jgi:hypothetical protein
MNSGLPESTKDIQIEPFYIFGSRIVSGVEGAVRAPAQACHLRNGHKNSAGMCDMQIDCLYYRLAN